MPWLYDAEEVPWHEVALSAQIWQERLVAELSGHLHIWASVVCLSAGCDAKFSGIQTLGVSPLMPPGDKRQPSYSYLPTTVISVAFLRGGLAEL